MYSEKNNWATIKQPSQQQVPILCVLHPDGFFELYGPANVSAHVATMPAMGTISGEVVAEDFLTITLPEQHREIYHPGLIRAVGNVRTETPATIAHRQLSLDLLEGIDLLAAGVTV